MTNEIKIHIPMPLIISIEDVGWWKGKDESVSSRPFRTGMPRDHLPEDYEALAALGKGLDTKVLAGFVLCEWDRHNILQKLPSSTWMGEKWSLPQKNEAQKEEAAAIIKKERKHIEFGFHGVGHEFWTDGRMERSEFHNDACEMREKEEVTKHMIYYFRLMDQYGFDSKPVTFIPPALRHSFGNHGKGFQKILNQFGIKYVTLVFNKAKMYSKPQTETIAWENDVLLFERGEADIKWDTTPCEPFFKFNRPVMALHWANILHPDPQQNIMVVNKWIKYLNEGIKERGCLLARDTESGFTQYLHHVMSRVEKVGEDFSIDLGWLQTVPRKLVGKSIFLKVESPEGIQFKILGTRKLETHRPAEKGFLKLALPEKGRKIVIKPYEKHR